MELKRTDSERLSRRCSVVPSVFIRGSYCSITGTMTIGINVKSLKQDFCIFSKTILKMCKSLRGAVVYLSVHISRCRQTFTSPFFLTHPYPPHRTYSFSSLHSSLLSPHPALHLSGEPIRPFHICWVVEDREDLSGSLIGWCFMGLKASSAAVLQW